MESLAELQTHLADKQATDVILALPARILNSKVWRDADQALLPAHWEVKYLRLRGLLEHHPDQPNLVALRSMP